jgi:UDP-N-acetylmuramyl pentapeptide phosphotransferase/UDP-N-acetylglucosamine-1-phosphate transferase
MTIRLVLAAVLTKRLISIAYKEFGRNYVISETAYVILHGLAVNHTYRKYSTLKMEPMHHLPFVSELGGAWHLIILGD